MASWRTLSRILVGAWLALLLLAAAFGGRMLFAQDSPVLPSGAAAAPPADAKPEEPVVDLRIEGNKLVPKEKILAHIRTRQGRPFDMAVVEEDVRRMNRSRMFGHVKPLAKRVPGGWQVVYEVVERPTVQDIKIVGPEMIKTKTLRKELGFKVGDPLDPFAAEEGRRKIEEFYRKKGFVRVYVTLLEGDKREDTRVVYLVNEGPKQKVLWTGFEGNTIASDGRLRTQIQSKPPFLYLFKGEVDRKQIDEDVARLTAYYRGLGFYSARVGRKLEYNETQDWLVLTFVIDEGPRFKLRNVSFIGHSKFSPEELAAKTKLKSGDYFSQSKMLTDVNAVQDQYGSIGHVFANVKPDIRYRGDAPELDLVYNITEGDRYRVGRIDVQIKGDNPHTRMTTVLNQFSFKPGEIVDTRKLRESEKRLKGSGLFLVDPQSGNVPKIVFSPPDTEDDKQEKQLARRPKSPPNFRGQSPDPGHSAAAPQAGGDRLLYMSVCREQPDSRGDSRLDPAPQSEGYRLPGIAAQAASLVGAVPRQLAPVQQVAVDSRQLQSVQYAAAVQKPTAEQPAVTPQYCSPYRPQPQQPQQCQQPQPGYQSPYRPAAQMSREETPSRGEMVVRGQYTSEVGPSETPRPSRPWLPWIKPAQPPTPSVVQSPAAGYAQPPTPGYVQPPAGVPVAGDQPMAPMPPQPQGFGPGGMPAPVEFATDNPDLRPATAQPSPFGTNGLFSPGSPFNNDAKDLPITGIANETQTGRFSFGVGVTSEAGVVGSIVLDEQNFDWRRWPSGWEEIRNATAWRGAGQRFRMEAQPGSQVQRYSVSFQDPYFMDSEVSLGLSGFYYDRIFPEWQEQRIGGRVSLGYHFTRHLSGSVSFRGESVGISNPADPTLPMLAEVVGKNGLYGFGASLAHDTRDSPFMATEGHLIEATFEQVIGTWQYARGEIDVRQYFLLHERLDGTGRHVLSLLGRVGITGNNTPIYDHYFAGGYSTIRGFYFRGASPKENNIVVGGQFLMLGSAEYMFPITEDDMLRGVVFCDTGTVEPTSNQWSDKYRVAVGAGLRICVPAMSPAPIALDFAVPLQQNPGDRKEVFSFFLGVLR